jgi:hypothetical protein
MSSHRLLLAILVVTCGLRAPDVRAAADIGFREFRLRHVCVGGASDGQVCCEPTDCAPDGVCTLDSIGKASGILTLVVDNDVSDLDGSKLASTQARALTAILETKGKTKRILAQTFQHLDETSLQTLLQGLHEGPRDEFGFRVTEGLLNAFVDTTGTGVPLDIEFLIFRTLDPETLKQLRADALLDPNGPELLVIRAQKLKLDRYEAHVNLTNPNDLDSADQDPFATVLRVKVNMFFVAPKPVPPCF